MQNSRTVTLGAILIVFGLFWWLNLWWLTLPLALLAGGVAAYVQRRAMGRTAEAVQMLVWGAGLSSLLLLHFVWPGIVLLAGASLLLRGREHRADENIQTLARRVRRARIRPRPASAPMITTANELEQRAPVSEPSHWQR